MENFGAFFIFDVKLCFPIVFGISYWLGATGCVGTSKWLCFDPIVYFGPSSLYVSGLYVPGPGVAQRPLINIKTL